MSNILPEPLITALREYLQSTLGLCFSEHHEKDLVRKIGYAAKAFGYPGSATFVEWLLSTTLSEQKRGELASHLTIGETYFFREKKGFDYLILDYLPELVRNRMGVNRRLRVWCAGCATGEEAYSLAIALQETIPDIQNWDLSILASDINPVFLEKAKLAIYSKWSFRNNTVGFVSKYFTKDGPNEYHLLPAIKRMVTFASINLAEGCYPSINNNTNAIDILFCRNVLIYFSPEGTRAVVDRFAQSLVKGGVLVVSPVEMSLITSPLFSRIHFSGYTIYQKGDCKPGDTLTSRKEISFQIPASPLTLTESKNEPVIFNNDQFELDRLKQLLPAKQLLTAKETSTNLQRSDNEYERARCLYERGAFQEAEAVLAELTTTELPQHKPAISLLAKTKANLGKLKEAEELCWKALQIDKLDPAMYYLMATVMQEQGDDEKAIQLLNRSIYLDNNFVLAHFLLGNLSMKSGNRETGKKSFNNAMASLSKLKPDEILPESDGMTVARFREIIRTTKENSYGI